MIHQYEPFESFRHGLVLSKIWLCEELEKVIQQKTVEKINVHVLGSWTNLISFMLIVRKQYLYNEFHGYDLNPYATQEANKVCDAWLYENPKVYNHTMSVSDVKIAGTSNFPLVFINCSVDQIADNIWFDNIPAGSIVCLQTTDSIIEDEPWLIKQKSPDIETFEKRYPLSENYFLGTKRIQYESWGYNRFMLIGIK